MQAVASKIEVGRRVRFNAGYGSVDGDGVIVAVHGEPNPAPAQTVLGGIGRVIRANDCIVDVILFDGRKLTGFNQCGIDRPGIGIKLLDRVHGPEMIEQAKCLAAKREADQLLAGIKAKQDFEAGEAARVIIDAPIFYWNGVKDAKGGKLTPCWYSKGRLVSNADENIISISARDYKRFSAKVAVCFVVHNDSDMMTDYFDSDRIRVLPCHPLYPQVLKAWEAAQAHNAKRAAKRNGGAK